MTIYYVYGYELECGKFNVIGAAWTRKAAEQAAKQEEAETGEKCTVKKVIKK